jgi:recombination protein RecT
MQAKNSLTKSQNKFGITAFLSRDAIRKNIAQAVGKNPDQFITSIISAVNANPDLQECTNTSILSAALVGQSLKLSPSPQLGQYYFVPYRNNRRGIVEAQFQIGYRGMYQLAIRSGQFRKLNAMAIKEGELVRFDPLEEEIEINLIEDEGQREAAETIGYYAFFELVNGFRRAMYWSREKMRAHALRYSKGYAAHKGYTFWEKDFDAMAIKTMYRQILKLAPMSIDMQNGMEMDYTTGDVGTPREHPDYSDVEIESAEPAPIAEKAESQEPDADVQENGQQSLFG